MKTLILTCHTGEGHNSAADAIYEELMSRDEDCKVVDALTFSGKKPNEIVTSSYNSLIVKAPNVFGWIYKAGDLYRSTRLTSPVYYANTLYAKNLLEYVNENQFDSIICTHLFPMEALTYLKRKHELQAKCYGVLTDYTCIPFFEETDLDCYFLPHRDLIPECTEKGMRKDRLIATGIPVHKKFSEQIQKKQARNHLVIPSDKKMYLIMTGGMGCGNILELCNGLLKNPDKNIIIYVLCGKNDSLKQKIDQLHQTDARVQAVVFTKEVSIYMKAADVLLSKSGGISSTEAAVTNIPLIHIMPIPGCETKNAAFFSEKGMSLYAKTTEQAAEFADSLINNPNKAERICDMQRQQINPNAARDIAAYVLSQ